MLEFAAISELSSHVRAVLLRKGDLDDSTPMFESPILRGETAVGVEFTLLAPRSVRLSAIWAAEEKRVHFYDGESTRFLSVDVKVRVND